jgi:hypothetical protein
MAFPPYHESMRCSFRLALAQSVPLYIANGPTEPVAWFASDTQNWGKPRASAYRTEVSNDKRPEITRFEMEAPRIMLEDVVFLTAPYVSLFLASSFWLYSCPIGYQALVEGSCIHLILPVIRRFWAFMGGRLCYTRLKRLHRRNCWLQRRISI